MEFNKEAFEKALAANKIVKYKNHFESVVKSYLEIVNGENEKREKLFFYKDMSGRGFSADLSYKQLVPLIRGKRNYYDISFFEWEKTAQLGDTWITKTEKVTRII